MDTNAVAAVLVLAPGVLVNTSVVLVCVGVIDPVGVTDPELLGLVAETSGPPPF